MMTAKREYAFDLDQFEREVMALLTDLRVDETNHADPDARKVAYANTVKRHGFCK